MVAKDEFKAEPAEIVLHLCFLTAAVALAMYFYPLESNVLKYVYLSVVGLSALSLLLAFVIPESEGSGEDDEEDAEEEDNEEEEDSPLFNVLGEAILLFPVGIAVLLGGLKSYQLIQDLGWI